MDVFCDKEFMAVKRVEFADRNMFNKSEINLDAGGEPLYNESRLIRSYKKAGRQVGYNDTMSRAGYN